MAFLLLANKKNNIKQPRSKDEKRSTTTTR